MLSSTVFYILFYYSYAYFASHTAKSEESDGGQQSLVGPVVGSIVGSIFGVGLLFTISTTAAIW